MRSSEAAAPGGQLSVLPVLPSPRKLQPAFLPALPAPLQPVLPRLRSVPHWTAFPVLLSSRDSGRLPQQVFPAPLPDGCLPPLRVFPVPVPQDVFLRALPDALVPALRGGFLPVLPDGPVPAPRDVLRRYGPGLHGAPLSGP